MGVKLNQFTQIGRKIICVGRNFAEHCKELNNPLPSEPLIFTKPTTAYVQQGSDIKIPKGCKNLHHEVELGVVIQKSGKNISEKDAMDYVGGYALALDMTARDWQDVAKAKGKPWALAKGFDTSCPVSDFIEKDSITDPHNITLWLKTNNVLRQNGSTKDMIFSIPFLISYISRFMTLETGDLLLTGTPEGVSQVMHGDTVECGIDGKVSMVFKVSAE